MVLAMNVALRKPRMSREAFLDWAQAQDVRHEFDGFQPVAMTGGTVNHSRITQNIHAALRARLRGGPCEPLGPDAGLATAGDAVRYPDALVTCTKAPGSAHLVPGVVTVFEVISPTSGQTDRIDKVREYRAVATIRRYVILEYTSAGLTVFDRANGDDRWTATTLTADILPLPEIGIEIPVAAFYENVDLSAPGDPDTSSLGDNAPAN
jgi:Uma2 family endonuclease